METKTKKPIVFFTSVSEEFYHSMGADKLAKSARYFHPEIPFVVLGTEEVNKINPDLDFNGPYLLEHMLQYYENAVRFDADSMIVARLDELLDAINSGEFDIIGVRNNNDMGMAGKDPAFTQHNVGVDLYLNTGLIATNCQAFLDQWKDDNGAYGQYLPFRCQTTYNNLARKFRTHIVDGIEASVYYGTSCLSGTETHWDSWMEIEASSDGTLGLNGKQVKVLHHAGGFSKDKMGFYMFNKETRKRLIEIIS